MKQSFFSILLLLSSASAQQSLEVRFVERPERTTFISAFQHAGSQYSSLSDLASTFQLDIEARMDGKRLDLKTDTYTIRVVEDNPFVVIVDRNNSASIEQLHIKPIRVFGRLFIPLDTFIPILNAVLREEIVFNRALNLIAVGEPFSRSVFDLETLSFEERANGHLVRLHLNKRIADYESWLKPIEADKPTRDYWLYVTLVGVTADSAALRALRPGGIVRQVVVFQSATSVQLTFRLSGEISGTELIQDKNGNDLLLAIHTPTVEEIAARKRREIEKNLERERSKWKMDVVVIDAGHGGKDPGAVGVTRVKEKDVTLGVALKLGKLIEKNLKDVKVVYTRTGDEFVELYRRGQIANQAGGKLFISIHCNSMPHKPNPQNGFEIYLLRPGKTDHAVRIAHRENAVIEFEEGYKERYQELTEENFIILTMAQSAYMKYSEQFADFLQREMETHSGLENQGVKQAGFYVLVGASMPNVLVETGYLSNRNDERFLKSERGQQKIAQGIFNAVKKYKQEYEKGLEEGKMMGKTEGG
jgi:N-acetylmuramoyl-L-alanine amidase